MSYCICYSVQISYAISCAYSVVPEHTNKQSLLRKIRQEISRMKKKVWGLAGFNVFNRDTYIASRRVAARAKACDSMHLEFVERVYALDRLIEIKRNCDIRCDAKRFIKIYNYRILQRYLLSKYRFCKTVFKNILYAKTK